MKQTATIMWGLATVAIIVGVGALSYTAGHTAATADARRTMTPNPTLPPSGSEARPMTRYTVTSDGPGWVRVRDGATNQEWALPVPSGGMDGVGQDRH